MPSFSKKNLDIYLSILLSALLLAGQYLALSTENTYMIYHFGHEYGNIAESIAAGNGFSNPFGQSRLVPVDSFEFNKEYNLGAEPEVVPTAWMPPLYPSMIATIFYTFGIKSAPALLIITVLKYLGLSLAFYLMIKFWGLREEHYKSKIFFFLITCFLVYLAWEEFVLSVHDIWLNILLISFALCSLKYFYLDHNKKNFFILGFVTMLLYFGSPILLFSFFTTALLILLFKKSKLLAQKFMVISFCLLIAWGSWGIRNYNTLGIFTFSKSNLWFDFYAANVFDQDGVMDSRTFFMNHPILDPTVSERYFELKEKKFMEYYQKKTFQFYEENGAESYFVKLINRFKNAFFYLETLNPVTVAQDAILFQDDIPKLVEDKILKHGHFRNMFFWVNIDQPVAVAKERLEQLDLINHDAIFQHWNGAHHYYKMRDLQTTKNLCGYFYALLPSLSILLAVILFRRNNDNAFVITSLLFTSYLLPYVFISHYYRYQFPLVLIIASLFSYLVAKSLTPILCRKKLILN